MTDFLGKWIEFDGYVKHSDGVWRKAYTDIALVVGSDGDSKFLDLMSPTKGPLWLYKGRVRPVSKNFSILLDAKYPELRQPLKG